MMLQPNPRCADHEHRWSAPGQFVVVYCMRCGLTLKASFAATERQIAQLPVLPPTHERYNEAA
jgi:hypothetical protein